MAVPAWIRRLLRPATERVPRAWLVCPECGTELVGPYHAGQMMTHSGQIPLPPMRAELVAKCPVHGHLPYNDRTRPPPWPRAAMKDHPPR